MSIRIVSALVATVALTAGQAHAFGEAGPLPVTAQAASTVSALDVMAQARSAQRAGLLVNGEAGQIRTAATGAAPVTQRAAADIVRAQARSLGASGNGEAGQVAGTVRDQASPVSLSNVRAQLLVPTL